MEIQGGSTKLSVFQGIQKNLVVGLSKAGEQIMRIDWFFAELGPKVDKNEMAGEYSRVGLAGGCILIRPFKFHRSWDAQSAPQVNSEPSLAT